MLAFISVIIALKQYGRSVALKRADYINELTGEIRTDEDIRDIVYLLDYGEIWYTEDFHNSNELERKMDKTLSYFSYIAYLRESNLLRGKEFEFFEYEIKRILINAGVRDYFYNLYHFAKHNDVPFTFAYLLDYGTQNPGGGQ